MKIIFCLPGFNESNVRLQPWLTVHRLGKAFLRSGHSVFVISDSKSNGLLDGIRVHGVKSLRGTNSNEVSGILEAVRPDAAIVSVTPLSLVSSGWYRCLKNIRSYAFFSYPLYKPREVLAALPYLGKAGLWSYGRHLPLSRGFWQGRLRSCFTGAFCQSHRTAERIGLTASPPFEINIVPPGIDIDKWVSPHPSFTKAADTAFLYMGSPLGIRGFPLVVEAFQKCNFSDAKLAVLARGADAAIIRKIAGKVKRAFRDRVRIIGGWMTQRELRKQLQTAGVTLLPFVLVPSELPVTVMETIACGTPAIVSNIDGLPEAVGNAGIVVPPADSEALASAMKRVHDDTGLLRDLSAACKERTKRFLSWESVAGKWLRIIEN